MADAGVIALIDQAGEFFSALDSAPAARAPLVAYPVELMITTPQERLIVPFHEGWPGVVRAAGADAAIGYWTLELRGDQQVFEGIFAGALTMGEAMYAGLLVAPEEKSKHNLTCAVGQAIRLVQDVHRRAKDPRNLGVSAQSPPAPKG
ncbi:hypothetical protein Mycsm_01809 [Mycobacterium sp. JS623]|uniref:hypothetical protein n=1 Tax=Mycobacterium sp. JS623 TaxID=212767 RepID=UPI0002A54FB9|nr:hypothetical protein [Mycobacterium sp. JS623]AGB22196.1 hypothetical protein Mycsm_01809 [Mycobacterium sp. JS623]